uniref:arrestin domain-containing protein 3-like n=1 Tax=Scatophagus argus TaxID=75038 RepID=UPI001ED7D56D|nr:arrestin domain-containing protein 3-like [Scatophagus argus]
MSPIKDLNVIYEALHTENTFSEGDIVLGTVTFTLTKEKKVSLFVKLKGDARVSWTEGSGDDDRSYSAHKRYFKVKEYLVAGGPKGTVLPQGAHCFNFSLKIPHGNMPSSFNGSHGKIIYMLEAKVSRNWRWPSAVHKELNFVSKSLSQHGQVKCPHSSSVDKKVGVFSKEQVQMSATIDRTVCSPGDTLSIVVKICNSSSKKMRPKFSLQQNVEYRASGATKTSVKTLCKMVGEMLKNSEETVSCEMKIPVNTIYTMQNCEIISVHYCLKVYLDISFAIDPELRFPLVIVPSRFALRQPGEAAGPYSALGAPSYSDFPPPAYPGGPYPVPAGPSAYGYPAPDPTQHANATCGFDSQWPQQVAPSGFSDAAFPPPSVQHQAPTAPPGFQQGEPPTCSSPFPLTHVNTVSQHKF